MASLLVLVIHVLPSLLDSVVYFGLFGCFGLVVSLVVYFGFAIRSGYLFWVSLIFWLFVLGSLIVWLFVVGSLLDPVVCFEFVVSLAVCFGFVVSLVVCFWVRLVVCFVFVMSLVVLGSL